MGSLGMQQLLYVGDAASVRLASLFKCEIVGRCRIQSIFLLTTGNKKGFTSVLVSRKYFWAGREEEGRKKGRDGTEGKRGQTEFGQEDRDKE